MNTDQGWYEHWSRLVWTLIKVGMNTDQGCIILSWVGMNTDQGCIILSLSGI